MEQTLEFLNALWEGMPHGPAIQVWYRGDMSTRYYHSPQTATKAIELMDIKDHLYGAAGLAPKVRGIEKKRCNAAQIVGIPGMWADIDVNGGPEGKTNAAPTRDDAETLAFSIIEPTVLVNSGYGVQAWWLFDDGPWIFGSDEEREQAQRLVAAFQAALRGKAAIEGYSLDSTFDLARLMRIPGTLNFKGVDDGYEPAPVEMFDHEGPRYRLETFGAIAESYMGEAINATRGITGAGIKVEIGGAPPMAKVDQLLMEPEFEMIWRHRTTGKTAMWSMSEWEMSMTNWLVRAGFTDQELADTLVYHREVWEPGDPKRKNRPARIAQTIAKARATNEREQFEREAEFERDEAVEQLAHIGKKAERNGGTGVVTKEQALALFTRIIGGSQIIELVQDGRDPETARFVMHLADGREVPLGKIDGLVQQRDFRKAFAVVTSHYPRAVKGPKWDEVIQGVLSSATVKEGHDDTRAARVRGWLEPYLSRKISTDRDAACRARDPWMDGDNLYVPLEDLRQFIRKIIGDRIDTPDLKMYLEAAGFERKTISYRREDGAGSSRSYFVAPKEGFES